MYTKLLIKNNIQKNIAGAATIIARTNILETLCFISDSRTQSFRATRNWYKLWVINYSNISWETNKHEAE